MDLADPPTTAVGVRQRIDPLRAPSLPRRCLPGRHRLGALAGALALAACAGDLPDPPSGAVSVLVPSGAEWRYLDDGSEPGESWTSPEFDDSSWAEGPAILGYGRGDELTPLRCRPDTEPGEGCDEGEPDRFLAVFLRHAFEVEDPTAYDRLRLRLLKDDGAVVYLNGRELARANLRPGFEGQGQAAASVTEQPRTWLEYRFEPEVVTAGRNVLAAEVHLAGPGNGNLGFDLELIGFDPRRTALSRGPYLQTVTSSRATVRWRTGDRVGSKLIWGDRPEALDRELARPAPTREHTLTLEGLEPASRYCYRVVAEDRALAGSEQASCFRSQPDPGMPVPVRVWVLGDSGTGDARARRVYRAYRTFAADRPADVWITLGDNAYDDGTDAEFQAALFDVYPRELGSIAIWPSLGNHDLRSIDEGRGPYYRIFDLPTAAEAGGEPSGTEAYYSFDHGPVHFVALDTSSGDLRPGREMLTWLEADLEATEQPWVIVYGHHPPYTDGWHRSDDTKKSWRSLVIRENVLPILERGGVDLFLAGHSHSYERSYPLHGHYGVSDTLKPSMILDSGDGREEGDGPYRKKRRGKGIVYVVAGSSGKLAAGELAHPVMVTSHMRLGSLVIDIEGSRLDLSFVTAEGEVADHFTLLHE